MLLNGLTAITVQNQCGGIGFIGLTSPKNYKNHIVKIIFYQFKKLSISILIKENIYVEHI
ncbi:hypothetical protein DNO_1185 [Dichelobacter nodosus VCS1703A]|uniref:Uncharacterized protein n=1 Tax=Dichelobacter nodosus (strain VCS1703A) TaxID=246195 RepID=A5EXG8_DICNV|nr:hypothetical protein DNO_1185 [Dichelobacter nodosus VCS1703A]KNZ39118.1 hypothetical protein AKG33_05035 [Dichelobacter nodosus]